MTRAGLQSGRWAVDINGQMARPRNTRPPMTPAQRQAKRRAIKRGTWCNCEEVPVHLPKGCTNPNLGLPGRDKQPPALPAAGGSKPALPAPTVTEIQNIDVARGSKPALPAPAIAAIEKASAVGSASLGLAEADGPEEAMRLSLPPAVAARLRSLIDRKNAGKLSAAERAEAEGLLDIAEYFIVQRLRRRLAA